MSWAQSLHYAEASVIHAFQMQFVRVKTLVIGNLHVTVTQVIQSNAV